jgi:ketosteroid isomerase-like protein
MKPYYLLSFFLLLLAYPGWVLSSTTHDDLRARAEIIRLLQKWPQDFNDKKAQEVCGLFAPNLVASYPGTTDRNFEDMCRQLTSNLSESSNRIYRYGTPEIEQIQIEGDLAVVRLIWTLTVSDKNGSTIETTKEKGLDVFRKQGNGQWKIAISYAYPLAP